jgi:hypothetical protein
MRGALVNYYDKGALNQKRLRTTDLDLGLMLITPSYTKCY